MAVGSNGLENGRSPFSRARSKIGLCHSQGVCASWYSWYRLRPPHSRCPSVIRNAGVSTSMVMVSGVYVWILSACAGLGHRVDDLQSAAEVAVVVSRHLGDDEGALFAADRVRSDAH